MATFRILTAALVLVGAAALAPAEACDSNYPWLCKPVPSIDPPEAAEANTPAAKPQPAAKPLPISAREARTSVKLKRAARVAGRGAGKSAARHWAVRARQAKIAAARTASTAAGEPARRSAAPPSDMPSDGSSRPTTGFAGMWADRSMTNAMTMDVPAAGVLAADTAGAAEPVAPEPVPAASPAATAAAIAAQPARASAPAAARVSDAAATDSSQQTSWLRGLFLAFGGLIAVGSALRFFL